MMLAQQDQQIQVKSCEKQSSRHATGQGEKQQQGRQWASTPCQDFSYLIVITIGDCIWLYSSIFHFKEDSHSLNRLTPQSTELHNNSVADLTRYRNT